MHVMVASNRTGAALRLSAVAFELNGSVMEPHEILQFDDRWFDHEYPDLSARKALIDRLTLVIVLGAFDLAAARDELFE